MYRKKSRNQEVARRTFVYSLMVLSMVGLLIFLMFNMLGYTFNFETKELQQTGLVHYDSYPRGAMVTIDGIDLRQTQTKSTVLPGKHTFAMKLNGYKPWQKTLEIKSDTVTLLNYVRLVPVDQEETTVKKLEGAQMAQLAPSGRYLLAIGHKNRVPFMTLGDLRNTDDEKFTEYLLNTEILGGYTNGGTNHSFVIHAWDGGERYVLVRHNYQKADGAAAEQWLRLDREDISKVIDVTAAVGFDIKQAGFVGGGQELYLLQTNGDVRHVHLGDNKISSPIVSGVQTMQIYGSDRLAYTAATPEKVIAGVWKKDWAKPFVVGEFAPGEVPVARVSRYFNKDTFVIGLGKKISLYRGELTDDPAKQKEFLATMKSIQLSGDVSDVSINVSGRMVMVRSGAMAQSYDLERQTLSGQFNLGAEQKIRWFDDFTIWSVGANGKLIVQEFDGMNAHEMLTVNKDLGAALSSNQRYIYGLMNDVSGLITLHKTNMTTGNTGWLFN